MKEMPEFVDIEVTQEDIDNGSPGDVCKCPIALAIKRKFPRNRVIVPGEFLVIGLSKDLMIAHRRYYKTTEVMREFISRFDSKNPVSPRKFRFRRASVDFLLASGLVDIVDSVTGEKVLPESS